MAQKSGFFDALISGGVADRSYTAADYRDCLAVVISNGVLRSINNDLNVTASGLDITVGVGRGFINGGYYHNTAALALATVTPPVANSRIDNVVLRFDESVGERAITLEYVTGEASADPTAPSLTRAGDVYELCIAQILVAAGANSVTITDTRSDANLCGWVYSTSGDNSFFTSLDDEFETWFESVKNSLSSVTLFKRYSWTTTLGSQSSQVTFDIPQYDADTCFIDVYVNGFLVTDYTQSGSVITFTDTLAAGSVIIVRAYKSIDGTGIMDVSDEITELQNEYATISGAGKFIYTATGTNDNISLSEIAKAFRDKSYSSVSQAAEDFLEALGGNAYLAALEDNYHVTISVVGKLGVTAAYLGGGTSVNPYKWFDLDGVIFDFSKCDTISITCGAGTYNSIINGDIRHCKLTASGGTILAFYGAKCDDCDFTVSATGDAVIAKSGEFINCTFSARSSAANAYVFYPSDQQYIRIIGGTFTAYNNENVSALSAVLYQNVSGLITAQNINCPVVIVSDMEQQYLAYCLAGSTIIDIVHSALPDLGNNIVINHRI